MRELVLTGFKEFWPQDESRAVFLGPWCFAFNHKYKFWEQDKFTLLPSPWKSHKDVLDASTYINHLLDRIFPKLSVLMNEAHNTQYGEKFWRIYLITWLLHWLGVAYERYLRLEVADAYFKEKANVKIIDQEHLEVKDYNGFMIKIMREHGYNLLLMSDILKLSDFKFLSPEIARISSSLEDASTMSSGQNSRQITGKIMSMVKYVLKNNTAGHLANGLFLGNIYGMSGWDKFYINLLLGGNFLLTGNNDGNLESLTIDDPYFSKKTIQIGAQNKFEVIVERLLLKYIPLELLTVYKLRGKRKNTVKTWVGNDIYRSTGAAFNIAMICDNGGRWFSVQHGGGYAATESFPLRKIEFETSDGFISWGCKETRDYKSGCYPLPSPKLSKLPNHKKRNDDLVFVGTMHPPYFYRLHSKLLPEQLTSYLFGKRVFMEQLKPDILSALKYRPYMNDYGVNEVEFVKKLITDRQLLIKGIITKRITSARLIVIDHMETTLLEALAMNAPTILYWDPKYFVISPEADVHYDRLRKASILFDSPQAAADKVNNVWDNVEIWWKQRDVQEARAGFCNHYASTAKNWRLFWAKELKKL